ncbi:uncharacterized protein H6S33_008717 [Morchella sextelata]|uniref:uncharacterized protein n=1 Tax=Morchella sextelata TaxID=1174677 RepID=UPI001D03C789|nr:uncharacterized protein H6S33_008717 [Morchella sextelata]KAH0602378.1 hypothetical protein H6S33_008717 [Morchella sextelata]
MSTHRNSQRLKLPNTKDSSLLHRLAVGMVLKLGSPSVRDPPPGKAKKPPITHVHIPLTKEKDPNAREAFICTTVGQDGKKGTTYIVRTNETKKEKLARLSKKLDKERNKDKQQLLIKRIEKAKNAHTDRMSHTLRDYTFAPFESKFEPGTPEWIEELEQSARDEQSIAGSVRGNGSVHIQLPEEPEHRAEAASNSGRSETGHSARHVAVDSSSGPSATGQAVHHAEVDEHFVEHDEYYEPYVEHQGASGPSHEPVHQAHEPEEHQGAPEPSHEPVHQAHESEVHEQARNQKLERHSNSETSSDVHHRSRTLLLVRRTRPRGQRPDINSDDSDSDDEGPSLLTASGSTITFSI